MRATVLIPTFDHGPLLRYAVESVRIQTVEDIEIFVVGDGVPAEQRAAVETIVGSDRRIRFFDFGKGPRHGEIRRHEALRQAAGKIVCYLSDDDLWLPDHVEVMEELLRDADFAHTLPVHAEITGDLNTYEVDLELPAYHDRFREGHNRVPLSCAGHTLAAYRRTPGWETTPQGTPTDLYMWVKFLNPDYRVKSGFKPTAINFPTPFRRDWTIEEREKELHAWWRLILDPEGRRRIPFRVIEHQARHAARSFLERLHPGGRAQGAEAPSAEVQFRDQREASPRSSDADQALREASEEIEQLNGRIARMTEEEDSLRARLAQMTIRREAAERLVERTRQDLASTSSALHHIERVHHEMAGTSTWRLREMIWKVPVLRSTARWVARALTRAGVR